MAELDSAVVEDFAERILRVLATKPKDARFAMTQLIQFVRESHSVAEETNKYRRIGDYVPEYVQASVELLLKRAKIKNNSRIDESYSLIC